MNYYNIIIIPTIYLTTKDPILYIKTSEFRVPTPKSCSRMKVSVSIIMDNQSRLLFPKTLPTYGDDSSDSRLK